MHTEKNSYSLQTSKNKDKNNFGCKCFTVIWKGHTCKQTPYNT